jgi:hypothetical protein
MELPRTTRPLGRHTLLTRLARSETLVHLNRANIQMSGMKATFKAVRRSIAQ